MIKRP